MTSTHSLRPINESSPPICSPEPIRVAQHGDLKGLHSSHFNTADHPMDGRVGRLGLSLPAYRRACYFAPFQKFAVNPAVDLWPEGYNQCQPLCVERLEDVKRGGMFSILELEDDGYLALLPLTTADAMASFSAEADGFGLDVHHWGRGPFDANVPVLAWARADDLYAACDEVWRLASRHPKIRGHLQLRRDKTYPDPLNYLGWCTWEHFGFDISEPILERCFKELADVDLPIRWALVDDGHLNYITADNPSTDQPPQIGDIGPAQRSQRLMSFTPDTDKFPHGWDRVLAAKQSAGLRWLGLWLNFNGYWGGVAVNHRLPNDLDTSLMKLEPGLRLPRVSPAAAEKFYDRFIRDAAEDAGFDFVKVDNQASNIKFYEGHTDHAVAAATHNQRALEAACHNRLDGLINCMAHNSVCAFNTKHSAVTRCSEDYVFGDLHRAKMHLYHSYANMAYFGHTVWGDHDMFHSTDDAAGEMMALSKALSGGPVYLSDPPEAIRVDRVRPLCNPDGRVYRPLAPATALPESLFLNPYADTDAFRVIAPLAHRIAAVATYNLTSPERPVQGEVSAQDYIHAGALLQDGETRWAVPREGLVVYDWRQQIVVGIHQNDLDATAHRVRLDTFSDAYFLLCPIDHGWAPVGCPDVYLSPAVIEHCVTAEDRMEIRLSEPVEFFFWSDPSHETPRCDQRSLQEIGGGLFRVCLDPDEITPSELTICRP